MPRMTNLLLPVLTAFCAGWLLLVSPPSVLADNFPDDAVSEGETVPPDPKQPPRCSVSCTPDCQPGGSDDGTGGSGGKGPAEGGSSDGTGSGGSSASGEPCPPPAPCPTNPDGDSGKAGDPVEAFTGRFRYARTDLEINGVFPIRMTRIYDSQATYDSPLGYGWSFDYDLRLYEYPDKSVIVRSRCGDRDEYTFEEGTQTYSIADPLRGRAPTLTKQGDNFLVTYPRGTIATFDVKGRLAEIRNPQGHRLVMTYSGERQPLQGISAFSVNPGAPTVVAYVYQLQRVEERPKGLPDGQPAPRFVDLEYGDTTGRLTEITSFDGERIVEYFQEPDGPGPSFRGNLTRVEAHTTVGADPKPIVSTYQYQDPNDPHNLTHLKETEQMTQLVNTYNADDRVEQQVFGPTTWSFVYDTQTIGPDTFPRTTIARSFGGPQAAQTVYRFNDEGLVLEKTDAAGNRFKYFRDDNPPFVDTVETWHNHPTNGLILQKTVSLEYDAEGNLTKRSVTLDPVNGITETITENWIYDGAWVALHWVVSDQEPTRLFGTAFDFLRDAGGNIIQITEIRRVTAWDTATTPPTPTAWHATTFQYDVNNRLQRIIPPAGPTIVRSYLPAGSHKHGLLQKISLEVAGVPDPHLERTFDYDAQAFLSEITDPRDPVNFKTKLRWDLRGRLKERENALGEIAAFSYSAPNETILDTTGNLLSDVEIGRKIVAEVPVPGQKRRLRWNGEGRLTAIERADDMDVYSTFQSFGYDGDGNRATSQDAIGRTLTFTYDLLRRLKTVTDDAASDPDISENNTTTFAYDAVGNRTSVKDALNRTTVFAYDDLDRLIAVDQKAESLVTSFDYNAAGNVDLVTDPETQQTQRTEYEYDLLSRLRSVTQELGLQTPEPNDFQVTYDYDPADRLERLTNARGNVLDYFYEPWGALKEVQHFPDAAAADDPDPNPVRTIAFTHDLAGNVETTSDSELDTDPGTPGVVDPLYTFTYDAVSRVDTVNAHYLPGGDRVLNSDYDPFGNRNDLTLTGDGAAISNTWRFNKLDRLYEVVFPGGADPTIKLGYRNNDELELLTFGDGTTNRSTADYGYFAHGPIKTIRVSDPTTVQLLELTYAVNEVIDITGLNEQFADTDPVAVYGYGYDGVSRLTDIDYPVGFAAADESFVYFEAGNRDDGDGMGGHLDTYAYDPNNRIEASPGRGYVFDDDGNLIEINDGGDPATVLANLTFDFTNRLRTYNDVAGSQVTTYLYDPFGRRIRKTVGGAATWYLWDGDRLLGEYAGSGTRQLRYAYTGGFAPTQVAFGSPGSETIYDVHTDHLDTPRLLTDSTGTPVWRAFYEAFGQAHLDPGNTIAGFSIRFPGQYYDAETGLHYNFFRYYDPSIGRYISADPMWELAGPNLYLYASLNPTGQIDYYGLWPFGLPGRGTAEKNAPGWVDRYVPDLTDKERDKLIDDALDEFGWGDVDKGRKLLGDETDPPEDLSDLSDEQKDALRDFLKRIEKGNESAVQKCRDALDGKPKGDDGDKSKGVPSQPDPPMAAP